MFPRESPQTMRPFVSKAQPALDRVRTAFRKQWQAPLWLNPYSPRTGRELNKCAYYFVAESRLAQADGAYALAWRAALDAAELGVMSSQGADMYGWMLSLRPLSYATRQFDALSLEVPRESLGPLIQRSRRLRQTCPDLAEIFEVERVSHKHRWTQRCLEWARGSPIEQFRILRQRHKAPGMASLVRTFLTPKRVLLARSDQHCADLGAQWSQSVLDRVAAPVLNDPWAETWLVSPRFFLGGVLECDQTNLALLEVRLSVRMHYLETGAYPAALSDISPEWLPEIPLDLWEQPLQYRLVDGEPVVYSLGPDGLDDAGRAFDPRTLTVNPTVMGDLVFGHLGGLKEAE